MQDVKLFYCCRDKCSLEHFWPRHRNDRGAGLHWLLIRYDRTHAAVHGLLPTECWLPFSKEHSFRQTAFKNVLMGKLCSPKSRCLMRLRIGHQQALSCCK